VADHQLAGEGVVHRHAVDQQQDARVERGAAEAAGADEETLHHAPAHVEAGHRGQDLTEVEVGAGVDVVAGDDRDGAERRGEALLPLAAGDHHGLVDQGVEVEVGEVLEGVEGGLAFLGLEFVAPAQVFLATAGGGGLAPGVGRGRRVAGPVVGLVGGRGEQADGRQAGDRRRGAAPPAGEVCGVNWYRAVHSSTPSPRARRSLSVPGSPAHCGGNSTWPAGGMTWQVSPQRSVGTVTSPPNSPV